MVKKGDQHVVVGVVSTVTGPPVPPGSGYLELFFPKTRRGIVAKTPLSAECRRLGAGLNKHCRRDMRSTVIMGWMLTMFIE